MTYKETVDLAIMMIKQRSLISGVPAPVIDKGELMVMLSMAQSEIQSTHKVSMEQKQIEYIEGENTYNLSQDLHALVTE
jgi:hypothetical protein